MIILRWFSRLVAVIVLAAAAYVSFALIAWRDIPVADLEQRYGDESLQQALIDGVPLRYRLQGSAKRPLVVLIHNHFMDMGIWDTWVEVLSPHFQLLRYDLSGHGLSGPDPSGVYTVERDVHLLQGLLQHLGLEAAALVGSSLGGNIAFHFAAQQRDGLQALLLLNSGGLKRKNSRSGQEIPAWADGFLILVPPTLLRKFLLWMSVDDAAISEADQQRFSDMWLRAGNRTAELARLRQFETGDPNPTLARIQVPSLILWGADNPQLPAALAQQFADKLSAASAVHTRLYPGAGHVLPLERAQDSAQDSLTFLLSHLGETP